MPTSFTLVAQKHGRSLLVLDVILCLGSAFANLVGWRRVARVIDRAWRTPEKRLGPKITPAAIPADRREN